jgi:hypothetical protein
MLAAVQSGIAPIAAFERQPLVALHDAHGYGEDPKKRRSEGDKEKSSSVYSSDLRFFDATVGACSSTRE